MTDPAARNVARAKTCIIILDIHCPKSNPNFRDIRNYIRPVRKKTSKCLFFIRFSSEKTGMMYRPIG